MSESSEESVHIEQQNDPKRKSKFNFSGMSFKDYVNNIKEELNDEMKKIVNLYITQRATRHHGVHLNQRKLQVKHPIFRLTTINAMKWVLDRAYLFKLKKGQTAYI